MNEILKALRPVKARIRRNRFLNGLAAGLAAGLGTAAALQAAAFLTPLPDRGALAAAAAAGVALVTAAANALRPVHSRTAAEAADACGLQERAITALEGGDEHIHLLQRQDAAAALQALDVRKIRPHSARKSLAAALGCAVLLAVLLAVPNPRDQEAASVKALRQAIRNGREAIARAEEADEAGLPEERKTELRRIAGDLQRELDRSRDAADAMVALDRGEQRLEQFRRQIAGEAVSSAQGSGLQAETDPAGDGNGIGEGNGDSASAESAAQRAEGTGNSDSVSEGAQLSSMQMQAALAALKASVNPSAGRDTVSQQGAGQAGQGVGGQSAQAASQSGSGATGTGQTGQSGGGAGTGSSNLEGKAGGQSSAGHAAGNRKAEYKQGNYETIYDPERIGLSVRDEMTGQNRLGDEGSTQLETTPGRGNLSGDVPWGEVLGDYAETEALAADRENLTVRERRWVTDYFTTLTDQQGKDAEP